MKKNKLQHGTLKLNKGRIATLQAGNIFGGQDKGGRDKVTENNCIYTIDCTASTTVYTTSYIACPSHSRENCTH
ncbi:hypothetical protein [uncultured Kordia sp.]|uniref:hypothetical protein n=1 Tax=uncultured Kordia sp. TaxID=507699 RepID=UPI0026298046|nr:hypothetical protein [uncultured Kordia sp.]